MLALILADGLFAYLWGSINLGVSQFHLPLKLCYLPVDGGLQPVKVAQRWPGHIELWSREPVGELASRLQCIGCKPSMQEGQGLLSVACPHGNLYHIRQAPSGFDPRGTHPSGSGTLCAMPRVVHYVRPGAAAPLHEFWSQMMGATCELAPSLKHEQCVVRFGTGQTLVFDERSDAPAADAYERDEHAAVHLCVYVDTLDGFKETFDACEAAGLLYANPRFAASPPWFGNALSWEDCEACGQFRIKDLGRKLGGQLSDGKGGAKCTTALVLELEIRSILHRSYPLKRSRRRPRE